MSVQLDGKGIGTMESNECAGNSFLDGWDGVLLEGRYELEDRTYTLVVYWDRSMMTVALPLSAVRIWMLLSRLMSRRADSSTFERLGLAGFALRNTSLIFTRTSSATILSRRRNVGSTDWMISSVGMDL